MEKINITVTAHVYNSKGEDDVMMLYSHTFDNRHDILYDTDTPFLDILTGNFPLFKWQYDDGNDGYNTNYCQYVAYPKYGSENYILATLETETA